MEKEKDKDLVEITAETFNITEELDRFNKLETEVESTIEKLDQIIAMFGDNDIARGASNRVVALIEQKIGLLMRKESIIKNIADLKRNAFTINLKITESANEGDDDLTRTITEYTRAIREQQQQLKEANNQMLGVLNKEETEMFFNKN